MKTTAQSAYNILIRSYRFLKSLFKSRNFADSLVCWRFEINPTYLHRGSQGLWVEPLGMTLRKALQWPWLLENLERINVLKSLADARITDHNGDIVVELQDLKLLVDSGEELFTIEELFLHRVYDFDILTPVVMIDIGMNVGFASLMFAARANVVAVYAFEPLRVTFQQAQRSFELNPNCSKKIQSEKVGLAGSARTADAFFNRELKGSSSLFEQTRCSDEANGTIQEKIQLKSANEVLDLILNKHHDALVVAKIDCEGAEYEILQSLAESGLLSKFAVFMIEWHRFAEGQSPVRLVELLRQAGFVSFTNDCGSGAAGMIYAARICL